LEKHGCVGTAVCPAQPFGVGEPNTVDAGKVASTADVAPVEVSRERRVFAMQFTTRQAPAAA
jgi:hypothetical protein